MKKNYRFLIRDDSDHIWNEYTKYLQLPMSFTVRQDEAYDSAVVTLDYTPFVKPFKKNSDVVINIDDNRYRRMIIGDDTVTEVYRRNKKQYQHVITCYEETKILDEIFIGNLSTTWDMNATLNEGTVGSKVNFSEVDNKNVYNANDSRLTNPDLELDPDDFVASSIRSPRLYTYNLKYSDQAYQRYRNSIYPKIKKFSGYTSAKASILYTIDPDMGTTDRVNRQFKAELFYTELDGDEFDANITNPVEGKVTLPISKRLPIQILSAYREENEFRFQAASVNVPVFGALASDPYGTSQNERYGVYKYSISIDGGSTYKYAIEVFIRKYYDDPVEVKLFKAYPGSSCLYIENNSVIFDFKKIPQNQVRLKIERYRNTISFSNELRNRNLIKRGPSNHLSEIFWGFMQYIRIPDIYIDAFTSLTGVSIEEFEKVLFTATMEMCPYFYKAVKAYGPNLSNSVGIQAFFSNEKIEKLKTVDSAYRTFRDPGYFTAEESYFILNFCLLKFFYSDIPDDRLLKLIIYIHKGGLFWLSDEINITDGYFNGTDIAGSTFSYIKDTIDDGTIALYIHQTTILKYFVEGLRLASLFDPQDKVTLANPATTTTTGVISKAREILVSYPGEVTIRNFMEKLITLIDRLYGIFYYDKSDPRLDTPLPEMTFLLSDSLSSILFEVGKVIKLVPRLSTNNTIYFDKYIKEDNPNYDDEDEEYILNMNGEDSFSGYVTDIKKMIATDDTTVKMAAYYPGKDQFTKAKTDYNNSFLQPDNQKIIIDGSDGIYKINSIKVRNCCKSNIIPVGGGINKSVNNSTVLDITKYIYEKSHYDLLDPINLNIPTNECKANAFYYTQGTNEIVINEVTSSQKASIYGQSQYYAIERIVILAMVEQLGWKTDLNDLNTVAFSEYIEPSVNFEFSIEYVPMVSASIKTEQFNISEFNKPSDTIYNMSATTPSSNRLTEAMQEEIGRRGQLDIKKSNVLICSLEKLPKLGERLVENGEPYFADAITYNFNPNSVMVDINYTKDFNKITRLINISKERRYYEILDKPAVDRTININRYSYIRTDDKYDGSKALGIKASGNGKRDGTPADRALQNDISVYSNRLYKKKPFKNPSYMMLLFFDNEKNILIPPNNSYNMTRVFPLLMPISTTLTSNGYMFTSQMYDNFNAGVFCNTAAPSYDYEKVDYDVFIIRDDATNNFGYKVSNASYVDSKGRAEYASMYIIDPKYNEFFDTKFAPFCFPRIQTNGGHNPARIIDLNEAVLMGITNSEGSKYTGQFIDWLRSVSYDYEEFINIKKDNREKLIFNYQQHFLSDKGVHWSPAFAKDYISSNYIEAISNQDKFFIVGVTKDYANSKVYDGFNDGDILFGDYLYNHNNFYTAAVDNGFGRIDISGKTVANRDYTRIGVMNYKTHELLFTADAIFKKGETIYGNNSTAPRNIPIIEFTTFRHKVTELVTVYNENMRNGDAFILTNPVDGNERTFEAAFISNQHVFKQRETGKYLSAIQVLSGTKLKFITDPITEYGNGVEVKSLTPYRIYNDVYFSMVNQY